MFYRVPAEPKFMPPPNANSDEIEQMEAVALRFTLESTTEIRERSSGEVRSNKIFSSSLEPELPAHFHPAGLFSETIFGPAEHWNEFRSPCRSLMGHIELPVPILHPLVRHGAAGQILLAVLAIDDRNLQQIIVGSHCVVISAGDTQWVNGMVVRVNEIESYPREDPLRAAGLEVAHQSEAVRWLLNHAKPDVAIDYAKREYDADSLVVRRLRECFDNIPCWNQLVLDALPVNAPPYRPMRMSSQGIWQRHDLTRLYQAILRRCALIRRVIKKNVPSMILRNETRLLHRDIDQLFFQPSNRDSRHGRSRCMVTLLETLQEHGTRLSETNSTKTWLGSARIPLVPDPAVPIHRCGLPADVMATEFPNSAVLLSQHERRGRAALQAFQSVGVAGKTVNVSPIVLQSVRGGTSDDISAFPLRSCVARSEALACVLADQNRSPASRDFEYRPTLDMELGCFYITRDPVVANKNDLQHTSNNGRVTCFANTFDVLCAAERNALAWNSSIELRLADGQLVMDSPVATPVAVQNRIRTTPGRVAFNELFTPVFPFINCPITRTALHLRVSDALTSIGPVALRQLLESLQSFAARTLTGSGLSVGRADISQLPTAATIVDEALHNAGRIQSEFERNIIGWTTRITKYHDLWTDARAQVEALYRNQTVDQAANPHSLFDVLVASRGRSQWMQSTQGIIGFPPRRDRVIGGPVNASNYRQGLHSFDYWRMACARREALVDQIERCSEADHLTGTLLQAMKYLTVTTGDCGTSHGIEIRFSSESPADKSVVGRVSCETYFNQFTDESLFSAGDWITESAVTQFASLGIDKLRVRSPVTCEADYGVCQRCYGSDLSTGEPASLGSAVGVNAALAIGQHAHELTLRRFRISGRRPDQEVIKRFQAVAPLSQLREALSACPTSYTAVLAPVSGTVEALERDGSGWRLVLKRNQTEFHEIWLDDKRVINLRVGERVTAGERLTDYERINPNDVFRILGNEAGVHYVMNELRYIFQHNRIAIDDKHLEVVIRRLTSLLKIIERGDSDFVVGELVSRRELRQENNRVRRHSNSARFALAETRLLGIQHFASKRDERGQSEEILARDGGWFACAAMTGAELPIVRLFDLAGL